MMSSFYTTPQKHVKKKRSAHPEERSGVQAHILSGHPTGPRCIGRSVPAATWATALGGAPFRGFISSVRLVRQDHDRLRCKPEEYVEADETGFIKLSHSNDTLRSGIPPLMVDWQEDVWNAMRWKSK